MITITTHYSFQVKELHTYIYLLFLITPANNSPNPTNLHHTLLVIIDYLLLKILLIFNFPCSSNSLISDNHIKLWIKYFKLILNRSCVICPIPSHTFSLILPLFINDSHPIMATPSKHFYI